MGNNECISSLVFDLAFAALQLFDKGSVLLFNLCNESITAL